MAGFRGRPRRGPSIALTIDLYSTMALSHGNNGEHASLESRAISMGSFRPIRFESIGFSHNRVWLFLFSRKQTSSALPRRRRRKGMNHARGKNARRRFPARMAFNLFRRNVKHSIDKTDLSRLTITADSTLSYRDEETNLVLIVRSMSFSNKLRDWIIIYDLDCLWYI